MVRVGIIEDDMLFLHALAGYIGRHLGIEVVGTASDIQGGISLGIQRTDLDVLIVDCCLEQSAYDGIQVIQEIRKYRREPIKFVFLTSVEHQDVILKAYAAGATRYLLKSDYQELISMIHDLMRDGISPMDTLLQDYRRLVEEEILSSLTTAEREVFSYLQKGRSRSEIVDALGKTEDTVKSQIKSILRKLQVSTTKEALEKVKRGGL